MKYDPDKHRRRSIRLKNYDYTQVGAYFVTICTSNRECLFGEIVDGEMRLNEWGEVVAQTWRWLTQQYWYVELDEWVVMPNHLHGIITIGDKVETCRGGSRTAPTTDTIKRKSLGRLIGAFKTVSTKRINKIRRDPNASIWQRNYYEHIIRSETGLNTIRRYIRYNASMWLHDEDNLASRCLSPEPRKRVLSGLYGFSEEESEFILTHGIEYRSCQ